MAKTKYVIRDVDHADAEGRFPKRRPSVSAGKPIERSLIGDRDDSRLRVLIVDDHRATTDTLRLLVVTWGHDVRYAYDGPTGLTLATAYRPDVLLLDILMPGLDGFEIIKQMRRHDHLKRCFIVAVTGRTDASHRCRSYEAGADLVLVKPVAPAQMQSLLGLESEHVRRSKISRLSISSLLTRAARCEVTVRRKQIGGADVGSCEEES